VADSRRRFTPTEQRDHLANVRTMLAWVRTSVTIMGLGFVVAKFGLVLDETSGSRRTINPQLAAGIGTALVVVAAAILVVAIREFVAVSRAIRDGEIYFKWWAPLTVSTLLVLVGIILSVYLVLSA